MGSDLHPAPLMALALRKEKLETIRKQLNTRRDDIAVGLSRATQELLNQDANYTDVVDQAAADTDRAMAAHMKDRDRESLLQIDEALKRIEQGNYGMCERCDERITEGRIKAFPLTTLCIDCKAELESESHRYPGRH